MNEQKNCIHFTVAYLLHLQLHMFCYFFFGFFTDWTFDAVESDFFAFPCSKLIIVTTKYSKKNAPDILNEFFFVSTPLNSESKRKMYFEKIVRVQLFSWLRLVVFFIRMLCNCSQQIRLFSFQTSQDYSIYLLKLTRISTQRDEVCIN